MSYMEITRITDFFEGLDMSKPEIKRKVIELSYYYVVKSILEDIKRRDIDKIEFLIRRKTLNPSISSFRETEIEKLYGSLRRVEEIQVLIEAEIGIPF